MSFRNAMPAGRTRRCTEFVALTLLAAIPLLSRTCFGQATLQQRSPVATGCVVDYDPTSRTAPGDAVEDRLLIGHIGGTERRSILEYDVSNLVPGQVDVARLTGMIGPNNSAPADTRLHLFYLGAGNGVVDVSDNILTGTRNFGSLQHTAGGKTEFDFSFVSAYREFMLAKPSYLRTQVVAGNTSQGWDAVYSDFPPALLQLTVRPVTASTVVYYQSPVAIGAATALGDGAFAVDTTATSAGVMNWGYSPYKKGRGLMEFDLGSIPKGAHITWAKLDGALNMLQGLPGPTGPNLQIAGYFGDGTATVDDVTRSASLVGTSGELLTPDTFSWNLDPSFVQSALASGNYLGLRFQPGSHEELQAAIVLNDGATSGWTPRLAVAYEVPEPGAVALLAAGVAALMGYRLGKRRYRAI